MLAPFPQRPYASARPLRSHFESKSGMIRFGCAGYKHAAAAAAAPPARGGAQRSGAGGGVAGERHQQPREGLLSDDDDDEDDGAGGGGGSGWGGRDSDGDFDMDQGNNAGYGTDIDSAAGAVAEIGSDAIPPCPPLAATFPFAVAADARFWPLPPTPACFFAFGDAGKSSSPATAASAAMPAASAADPRRRFLSAWCAAAGALARGGSATFGTCGFPGVQEGA